MSQKIHPTSVVSPDVELGPDVEIGPYCLIQGKVKIGKGSFIEGHCTIGARASVIEIGENNHFSPGAVIGGPPQDVSYKGEPTALVIGNNNTFREFSTVNTATTKATGKTVVGNNGYFMAYSHIGHDCQIGNNVVIANNSQLGGHCEVGDNVVISAVCGLAQFTRIGKGAFLAGGSLVNKDILPFSRAAGNWALVRATNKIGMLRRGVTREEVAQIHKCIRIIVLGSATMEEAMNRISTEVVMNEHVEFLLQFIRSSKRGIAISKNHSQAKNDEE